MRHGTLSLEVTTPDLKMNGTIDICRKLREITLILIERVGQICLLVFEVLSVLTDVSSEIGAFPF